MPSPSNPAPSLPAASSKPSRSTEKISRPRSSKILTSTHIDIVLSPSADTITGVASDYPGAIVTLIPSDPTAPPVKQIAGDDGQFTFTNLRPGEYRLYAWDQVDDDLWPDPDFRKRYDSTTVEITVAPRSTVNSKLRVNQSPED